MRPLLGTTLASLFACFLGGFAAAEIPNTIPHQGRIAVDGVNFDGVGQFKFALLAEARVLGELAEAIATIGADGTVTSVEVTNGGTGYASPPFLRLSAQPEGDGGVLDHAQLESVVSNGSLISVNVLHPGSRYQGRSSEVAIEDPGYVTVELQLWSNDNTPAGEPTTTVPVGVSRGLYSVRLGGENMKPLPDAPEALGAHSSIFLRVWFDDGTNGSMPLAPDTPISSIPFALHAKHSQNAETAASALSLPPGTITSEMIVDGAITRAKFGTTPSATAESAYTDPLGGTLAIQFDQPFETPPVVTFPGLDYVASNVTTTGFEFTAPRSINLLVPNTDDIATSSPLLVSLIMPGGLAGVFYRTDTGWSFVRMLDTTGLSWTTPVELNMPDGDWISAKATYIDGKPALYGLRELDNDTTELMLNRAATVNGNWWNSSQSLVAVPTPFAISSGLGSIPGVDGIDVALIAGKPAITFRSRRITSDGSPVFPTTTHHQTVFFMSATSTTGGAWGSLKQFGPFSGSIASPQLVDLAGKPCLFYGDGTGGVVSIAFNSSGSSWSAPQPAPISYGNLYVADGRPAILSVDFSNFYFTRATNAQATSWSSTSTQSFTPSNPIIDGRHLYWTVDGSGALPKVRRQRWEDDDVAIVTEWIGSTPSGGSWQEVASPAPAPPLIVGNQFVVGGFAFDLIQSYDGLRLRSGDENLPDSFEWIASSPGGGVFGEGTLGGGSDLEVIFGQYNEAVPNATLIVGNGADSDNRSNALAVTSDGDLYVGNNAYKPGGGSFLVNSDARLKNLGAPFQPGLDAIAGVRPLHYRYRHDNPLGLRSTDEYIGVSAQELEAAIPDAVEFDEHGYRVVNNDVVMWTMLNAIKELQAEVATLRKQQEAKP